MNEHKIPVDTNHGKMIVGKKKVLDIFQTRVLQLYFFDNTVEEYFISFTSNLVAS